MTNGGIHFRALATQLQKNIAAVASRWRRCVPLDRPGSHWTSQIKPQTSCADIFTNTLTGQLTNMKVHEITFRLECFSSSSTTNSLMRFCASSIILAASQSCRRLSFSTERSCFCKFLQASNFTYRILPATKPTGL